MTKSNFRQRDLERIFRAAKAIGATVQIDLKTLMVKVIPNDQPKADTPHAIPAYGKDNWDEAPPEPIHPPLDHRECRAMERLVEAGVGVKIDACSVRSFGPHSQQKLLERGYIEVFSGEKAKYNDDEISLTKRGLDDWNAQRRHTDKYPFL